MAVEQILGLIVKFSNDLQGLLQLKDFLKIEEKELAKHKQDALAATQRLDPLLHSLGYLYLLYVLLLFLQHAAGAE